MLGRVGPSQLRSLATEMSAAGMPAEAPRTVRAFLFWTLRSGGPKRCVPSGASAVPADPSATSLHALFVQDFAEALVSFATREAFPGGELVERHGGALRFRLPASSDALSVVFSRIEAVRLPLHIQSYSLGQTTLEQVCISDR